MNNVTLGWALIALLTPIRRKPMADRILTDIETIGRVTDETVQTLIRSEDYASSGEAVLLDLAKNLLDYSEQWSPRSHPANALRHLDGDYAHAYVSALAIAWRMEPPSR